MSNLPTRVIAENDFILICPSLQQPFQESLWAEYVSSGYFSVKIFANILESYIAYSILSPEQLESLTDEEYTDINYEHLPILERDISMILWKWNCFHMYNEHPKLPIFYGPPLHPPIKEVW